MKYAFPLAAVVALMLFAWIAVQIPGMQYLFGVVIPYLAVAVFLCGFVYRVLKWGKSPVPALDQTGQAGMPLDPSPGAGPDAAGNPPLPFALAQHQGDRL